jgi:hypothetical protein
MLKVQGLAAAVSIIRKDVNSTIVIGSIDRGILRKISCIFEK